MTVYIRSHKGKKDICYLRKFDSDRTFGFTAKTLSLTTAVIIVYSFVYCAISGEGQGNAQITYELSTDDIGVRYGVPE